MKSSCLLSLASVSALAALALFLGGCASSAPTESGFLPKYTDLVPVTGKTHAFASSEARPTTIDSLAIAPVELRVDREKTGLTDAEVGELCTAAQTELRRALGAKFGLAASSDLSQGLVFRSAITRVNTSSAVVNAVTTAALLMPLNNGGICLEWELVDEKSGTRIASGVNVATGKPWQVGAAFKKIGQATHGLHDIADDIAALLSDQKPPSEIRPVAK